MKNIFFLITILALSGCKFFTGAARYNLANMKYTVPAGTPIFQQGYRDGCENGLLTRGNTLYRMKYRGFNYTPSLIENPEYKFAYGRGYGYCFTINTAGSHAGGTDAFIYGKGVADLRKTSLSETLNYETGTWNNPLNDKYGGLNGVFDGITKPKGFSVFGSHPFYGTSHNQIFDW